MSTYKPPLTVSVNPSYYCNLRCGFCYLTPEQLGNKQRLSLDSLRTRLEALQDTYELQQVDLYGGEVFMLPRGYLKDLKALLQSLGNVRLNIITNLTVPHPFLDDPDFYLTVSYDGVARERHEEVLERMQSLERDFSVLMLASREFLTQEPLQMHLDFSFLPYLKSVELKPYSRNQANQQPVAYTEFEDWVKAFIEVPLPRHYEFVNEGHLQDALSGRRNAYSDDHVYITPSGRYAVLEFDLNDNEYFLELDTVDEYQAWTKQERTRVTQRSYCGQCEFLGNCLTEHLRPVKDVEYSCNGFYQLLKWAQTKPEYQPVPVVCSPVKPNEPIWKDLMRQHHARVVKHTDELSTIRVIEREPCWADIAEYLTERNPRLIYPAKAIAVATIYAWELADLYGGCLTDYLSDPDLFIGTDKYFSPYRKDSPHAFFYEAVAQYLATTPNWRERGWVPETLAYFEKECVF